MAIPRMMQRQTRVMQKHARSRVTHYFFDFFFHVWAVTMDYTFAACAFLILKRTFIKTHERVFPEFFAFGTYFAMGFVVVSAIDFNHVTYSFLFPFHPFVFGIEGLRLHAKSG